MSRGWTSSPHTLLAGLLAALLLAGCASETEFEYPEFEQWSARDGALDCAGLERDIRRTDAVRWSMREDGVVLGGRHAKVLGLLGVIAGAAMVPLDASAGLNVASNAGRYAFDEGEKNQLEQADRRLVRLLQRKRALGCAATPTDLEGLGDLQLLERIEALNRRQEAGEISHKAEVEARSLMFDDLGASGGRDAGPPRGSASPGANE